MNKELLNLWISTLSRICISSRITYEHLKWITYCIHINFAIIVFVFDSSVDLIVMFGIEKVAKISRGSWFKDDPPRWSGCIWPWRQAYPGFQSLKTNLPWVDIRVCISFWGEARHLIWKKNLWVSYSLLDGVRFELLYEQTFLWWYHLGSLVVQKFWTHTYDCTRAVWLFVVSYLMKQKLIVKKIILLTFIENYSHRSSNP